MESRQCCRAACKNPAASTLTYDYKLRMVWIDDLWSESEPSAFDLCRTHISRFNSPNGWQVTERRNTAVQGPWASQGQAEFTSASLPETPAAASGQA